MLSSQTPGKCVNEKTFILNSLRERIENIKLHKNIYIYCKVFISYSLEMILGEWNVSSFVIIHLFSLKDDNLQTFSAIWPAVSCVQNRYGLPGLVSVTQIQTVMLCLVSGGLWSCWSVEYFLVGELTFSCLRSCEIFKKSSGRERHGRILDCMGTIPVLCQREVDCWAVSSTSLQ